MTRQADVASLIDELLAAPEEFNRTARAMALLDLYFDGAKTDSLQPLLLSEDPWVQRTVGFILSELGSAANRFAVDALRLLSSSDVIVRGYALDIIANAAHGGSSSLLGQVAEMLNEDHQGLRLRAMDLMTRATSNMIHGALRQAIAGSEPDVRHVRGLSMLVEPSCDAAAVECHLSGDDKLLRRYAAIAVVRRDAPSADAAERLLSVEDADVHAYAEHQIRLLRARETAGRS